MKIIKKVKCIHCETIIEESGKCKCGKVILNENIIVEGKVSIDLLDLTPILLNE